MRYIISLFAAIVFMSCAKEKTEILNLKIKPEEITKIELRADHKTMLANGVAVMEFYPIVYAARKVVSYMKDQSTKEFKVIEANQEFVVPRDQLPDNLVKVYDSNGKELPDNRFSTTTHKAGDVLDFYAKGGNLTSNHLQITIRETPDQSYEEIVIPVVFHILVPPATAAPTYDVTQQFLEQQLQEASDIFNGKLSSDPNGGNAKVTFKLALYDPNGLEMTTAGKNVYDIPTADYKTIRSSQKETFAYILTKKSKLIWDPTKYLNVWLTKYKYENSFSANLPTLIQSSYETNSIPGLSLKKIDGFGLSDVTNCLEVGVWIDFMTFLNPNIDGYSEYCLSYLLGTHYGLLDTNVRRYSALVDNDSDYCPDTYYYYYGKNQSAYKTNELEGQPEGTPVEYFTSYNVMDVYSRNKSITVDQARRVRTVLERCPACWAYKSKWAFTGK